MALQKTIVLTALPNGLPLNVKNMDGITSVVKSPVSKVSILIDSKRKDGYSSDDISPAPVRKRQRLDHLTHEEKIQRRKLKNRVAAQSARDRKKEKMNNLEDEIEILKAEKQMLLQENFVLQQRNLQLEEENSELKKRLQEPTTDDKESSTQDTKVIIKQEKDSCDSLEHAAGTGSSAVYSLDDALSLFADDSQSDDLLDLLQQCSEELLREGAISTSIGIEGTTECNSKERSNDQVVGSTSEELESVKELIEFDHIYYKHEDVSLTNQQVISTENEKEPIILSSEKLICERDQHNTEHSLEDCQLFPIPSIVIKQECDDIPEPVSPLSSIDSLSSRTSSPSAGDSGYDTSNSPFNSSSPFSDHENLMDDPWSDTFTELFPSLV